MWNLNTKQTDNKQQTEQNRLIDPENKWVVSRREGGGVVSKIGQRD